LASVKWPIIAKLTLFKHLNLLNQHTCTQLYYEGVKVFLVYLYSPIKKVANSSLATLLLYILNVQTIINSKLNIAFYLQDSYIIFYKNDK